MIKILKSVYDEMEHSVKREGRKVYNKYLIESGDINIQELNKIFSKYNKLFSKKALPKIQQAFYKKGQPGLKAKNQNDR